MRDTGNSSGMKPWWSARHGHIETVFACAMYMHFSTCIVPSPRCTTSIWWWNAIRLSSHALTVHVTGIQYLGICSLSHITARQKPFSKVEYLLAKEDAACHCDSPAREKLHTAIQGQLNRLLTKEDGTVHLNEVYPDPKSQEIHQLLYFLLVAGDVRCSSYLLLQKEHLNLPLNTATWEISLRHHILKIYMGFMYYHQLDLYKGSRECLLVL